MKIPFLQQSFPRFFVELLFFSQIVRAKTQRQQILQGVFDIIRLAFRQNDLESVIFYKFHHNLPANTAGRAKRGKRSVFRKLLAPANDCNGCETPTSFRDCLKKCRALCAISWGISGILDVTAPVNTALVTLERCPDLKVGIGCIGCFSGLYCLVNQSLNHIRISCPTGLGPLRGNAVFALLPVFLL